MAEALALVALFAALAAAIARHDRAPEALVALGGAAILIAVGVLSWSDARAERRRGCKALQRARAPSRRDRTDSGRYGQGARGNLPVSVRNQTIER